MECQQPSSVFGSFFEDIEDRKHLTNWCKTFAFPYNHRSYNICTFVGNSRGREGSLGVGHIRILHTCLFSVHSAHFRLTWKWHNWLSLKHLRLKQNLALSLNF